MRTLLWITLWSLTGAPAVESGFVSLFDGRTLDGWQITGPRPGFEVKDGCIYSISPAGANWLATARDYTNFELRFDWQISEVGNSGVQIRNAFEVQLLAPWTPHRDDLHCTASLYGHVAPQNRPSEEGLRWRAMTIIARDYLIEIYVDGELCTNADLREVPTLANASLTGPIELQDAHSKAGEWVMFRNLRIRDLDADPELALAHFKSDDPRLRALVPPVAARVGAVLVRPALQAAESDDPQTARYGRGILEQLGATADRLAVEREVLGWLGEPHGLNSRRQAVALLSRIGGRASLPALTGLLRDDALRDAAIQALVRSPEASATKALAAGPPAVDLVLGLQARHDPWSAPTLSAWTSLDDATVRDASLRALGAVGDKYAVPVLLRAAKDRATAGPAIDGLLAMADSLPASDPQRVWLYDHAWTPLATAEQQAAALEGWLDADPHAWPLALSALDMPGLEQSAEAILMRRDPDGLASAILQRLDAGDLRPALLRWITIHCPERAETYLLQAAGDERTEVLAYQLIAPLANEALLDHLRLALRTTDGVTRTAVVAGLLTIAEARRAARKDVAAAGLFAEVLDSQPDGRARRQAILGLGATGNAETVALLTELIAGRDRAPASEALLQLSGRLDREPQIALLTSLVKHRPVVTVRDEAVAALAKLGVALDLAHEQGFITRWWLKGPLPGTEDAAVEQAALAADGPDLKSWTAHHELKSPEGVMEFGELFKQTQNQVVYCYAEVTPDAETKALLKLGSDDGYKLWLNGELVGERPTGRMLKVDDETHEVTLRQGVNRIVFKVMNGGSRWAGVVRLTSPDGAPLVLQQRE